MGGIFGKWFQGKYFKKWFRKDNLVVLILAGVLLVIIALPTKEDKREGTESPQAGAGDSRKGLAVGDGGADTAYSDEEYAVQLERKLGEILSQMEGVGKVRVMVTLKSSQELVVEKEQPYLRSATTESDAQGGNRTINQTETEENTVYRTNGNVSEPYVVKTLPPKVEGVVVVAEGAGSGTVNRTIVELIQALYGVDAHKVKVVKMEIAK